VTPTRARTWTVVGVFVGLVVLALIPLGIGPWTGRVPYQGDAANVYHPLRTFTRDALARGEMPWWNFRTACGIPHLTDAQSAFWDPLTRLVELFDPATSLSVEIVIRLALAASLVLATARVRGRSWTASWLAAASLVLSGFFVIQVVVPPGLRSLSFAPGLALGAAIHWSGRPRAGFLVVAGCWAMSLVGGHAQFSFAALPVGAALALGPPETRWRQRMRGLAFFAAAIAVGTLVAGVALAPGVLYGPFTQRAFGFSEIALKKTATHPARLFDVLFGRTERASAFSTGLVAPMLACCAIAAAPRRSMLLVGAAAFGVVASLGPYTPLGAFLHHVPPYNLFHYAERHFEATQLAVSLLAADGLDLFVDGQVSRRKTAVSVAVVFAGATAGFFLALDQPCARDVLRVAGGVVAAALLLARPGAVDARRFALVGLCVVELTLIGGKRYWTDEHMARPAELRVPPPEMRFLAEQSGGPHGRAVARGVALYETTRPLAYGIDHVCAHFALLPRRLLDLAWIAETGAPRPDGPVDGPLYDLRIPRLDGKLLDVFGIRWAYGDGPAPSGDWRAVAPNTWERGRWLPEAAVFDDARGVRDVADAAKRMNEPTFDPTKTILVEGDVAPTAADASSPAPSVVAVRVGTSGFDVELAPGRAAWLYASFNHLPGFRCEVDGVAAPIRTADVAFMAVALPPGARRATFRYDPPGFALGAWLSAAGFVVLALVAWRIPSRDADDGGTSTPVATPLT
jgi:hypothetical protein